MAITKFDIVKIGCVALGVAFTMLVVQFALGIEGILGGALGGGVGVLVGIGLFNFITRGRK